MTPLFYCALCAVAVAGLLAAERRENMALRMVFKPAASLFFVLAAIAAGASQSPMGLAILTGLGLSAFGDMLLIGRDGQLFLAGMAAFGFAHLAYAGAFAIGGLAPGWPALAAGGATLGAGACFLAPIRIGMGAMAGPVVVYAVIIAAMVALSVAHHEAAGNDQSARLAAGAAAFAASDLAVARDRFGVPDFRNRLWGLPLYYAAQCLIATAV